MASPLRKCRVAGLRGRSSTWNGLEVAAHWGGDLKVTESRRGVAPNEPLRSIDAALLVFQRAQPADVTQRESIWRYWTACLVRGAADSSSDALRSLFFLASKLQSFVASLRLSGANFRNRRPRNHCSYSDGLMPLREAV